MAAPRIGRAVLELGFENGTFVRGAADTKAVARDLGRNIAQVQRDIEKRAFTLSGRDQLAEASKLTAAIEKIGGASRLTAAEKAKVNSQLSTAVEKYRALGREAPAAMLSLEKATRRGGDAASWAQAKWAGFGAAAGVFASQFGMQAVRSLGAMAREAFEAGGKLVDLSAQTGLSTRTLQRMEAVANQTGASLDAMADAAYKGQIRIASGGATIEAALAALGLSLRDVQAMGRDEQWETIIKALGRIQDTTKRNQLGTDIYGKAFKAVAAGVSEDYQRIADAAKISSDAQLRALDLAGDRYQKFRDDVRNTKNSVIGDILLMVDEFNRLSLRQKLGALASIPTATGIAGSGLLAGAQARALAEVQRQDADKAAKAAAAAGAAAASYEQQLAKVRAELGKLTAAQKKEIDAALQLGVSTDDLEDKFGLADGTLRLYTTGLKNAEKASTALAKSQKTLGEEAEEASRRWLDTLGAIESAQIRADAEFAARQIPSPFGPIPEGDRDAAQASVDRGFAGQDPKAAARMRLDAERAFAATIRDLAFDRTEFEIKQAERAGVSRIRILRMEEDLSRQRYHAEREDARRTLEQNTRGLNQSLEEDKAEIKRFQLEYEATLARINQAHGKAADEREARIREEIGFWRSELGKAIGQELEGIKFAVTGRIFSTLVAGADSAAKEQARRAREHYEQLAQSGKASAEEITRAFREMREAEAAAQTRWADRFKAIWDAIFRHVSNIFDMLLEKFVGGLLDGMLDGLAKSAIGKRIGSWLAALPGLSFLGGGASALPGAAAAPSLASLLGAPPAAAAGTAAATGGGAGGAVAGTAAGFGLGTALATAGAFALPLGVAYLAGAFERSGFERIQKARELLRKRVPESQWPDWVRDDKDTMRRVHEGRAFDHYGGTAFGTLGWGDSAGLRTSTPMSMAVPPMRPPTLAAPSGAATVGGSRGQSAQPSIVHQNVNVTINGSVADVEVWREAWRRHILPFMKQDLVSNTDDLGYTIRRTAETDEMVRKGTGRSSTGNPMTYHPPWRS